MPIRELVAELQNDDPQVRRRAIVRLQRIGGEEAAGALVLLLSDTDVAIRQLAADALVSIGNEAVDPAVRYLANWQGPLGLAVPSLAGRLRIKPTVELLARNVGDPDPSVRAAIATALGSILRLAARGFSADSPVHESAHRPQTISGTG